MPIVSLGTFQTHGKTFTRGQEITSDVLNQIPACILKIQIDQGQVRNVSEDDAQVMRWEQDEKNKEAVRVRKLKKVARLEEKIRGLELKLESNSTLRINAEKAVKALQGQLSELMAEEESPLVEPDPTPKTEDPTVGLVAEEAPSKPELDGKKGKGKKGKRWG